MNTLITKTGFRFLTPLLFAYSFYLLLRGHNEPGGGFAGGLVAGMGLLLLALAKDFQPPVSQANVSRLMAVGLLLLAGSGLVGVGGSEPFMNPVWWKFGGIKVGTPLIFDVGVYLVVIGLCAQIFASLKGGELWKA